MEEQPANDGQCSRYSNAILTNTYESEMLIRYKDSREKYFIPADYYNIQQINKII